MTPSPSTARLGRVFTSWTETRVGEMCSYALARLLCIGLLASALGVVACSGAPRAPVRHAPVPDRVLALEAAEPRLVITPAAAWLVGLSPGQGYERGDWVQASPLSALWPERAERPTLAVGRVAERGPDWARVELLAVVDSQRSDTFSVAPLAEDAPLPAVTKRLLPVYREPEGVLTTPAGVADLVTGREIYAVLPADAPRDARFAASFRGLVTLLPLGPRRSQLVPYLGSALPKPGDHIVLVDAIAPPHLPISIEVASFPAGHPLAGQESVLRARLERRLRELDIGNIRVLPTDAPLETEADVDAHHSGQLGEALVITLHPDAVGGPLQVRVSTQLERVALHPALGARPEPAWRPPNIDALVELAAALTLTARGECAAAALLLEPLITGATPWTEILPLLAAAWLQTGRHDWEFELDLELAARDDGARFDEARLLSALRLRLDARARGTQARAGDGPHAPALHAALTRHALRSELSGRARSLVEALPTPPGELPAWQLELELEFAIATGATERARALLEAAQERPALTRIRLERIALALNTDADALDVAAREIAARADTLGAPAEAFSALLHAAPHLDADPQRYTQRLVRAAALADAARRTEVLTHLLGLLELTDPAALAAVLPEPLALRYVDALATLDQRTLMGLRGLHQAQRAGDLEVARDAINLARELFLSVGDHHNLAFAHLALAEVALHAGLFDETRQHLDAAHAIEERAPFDPLTAARGRLEQALELAEGAETPPAP